MWCKWTNQVLLHIRKGKILIVLYIYIYSNTQGRIQRGAQGARAPLPPNPPDLGHKPSKYSNKAVAVFIRQCSLSVKL